MTFEQYAAAMVREAETQTFLLRRLCAALNVQTVRERVKHRREEADAAQGGFAETQQRRRNRKAG